MCDHHHEENSKVLWQVGFAFCIFIVGLLMPYEGLVKFIVFFVAYLVVGGEVLLRAIKNIVRRDFFDENFLMSLATMGAFGIGEYPEAVMVMLLYQLGEFLQDRAVEKSRHSISKLVDIKVDYANVEEDGLIVRKAPMDVHIGDVIVIKVGEKIPLDGVVIDGISSLDTKALTGEALPKNIQAGDEALSGCINISSVIKVRVNKEFSDSIVAKILELVEHADSKKSRAEKFITKFAKYYTPAVVICAFLLFLVPTLFFGMEFKVWFERALTFLVISCPCALVISVPLSFFAGIGKASNEGILIKGASYLEKLASPYAVVFDKTGTLTEGNFAVTQICVQGLVNQEKLIEIAALAETYSNHPIAQSIKDYYGKEIRISALKDVKEFAGLGLKALTDFGEVLVGNEKLMEKFKISYNKSSGSGTVVYIALDNQYLGYIKISDEIKPDAVLALKNLKALVHRIIMLTGDSFNSAKEYCKVLGIKEFYANLLPTDKVSKLEEVINSSSNGNVLYIGDGINDAPVIMRSDVGIAMGALGSDAAIEAADVVIMDDKPSKVYQAISVAKNTMSIVKQNIIFALTVKLLFLILGTFGYISMWGAVFADVGVTILAVLNSLRILYFK